MSIPYHEIMISIHAPTKGATVSDRIQGSIRSISIHAPTKGATFKTYQQQTISKISIHAPTKGATMPMGISGRVVPFQSTLPRRERPTARVYVLFPDKFQSTLPRRERLLLPLWAYYHLPISIHAPTKGATIKIRKRIVIF